VYLNIVFCSPFESSSTITHLFLQFYFFTRLIVLHESSPTFKHGNLFKKKIYQYFNSSLSLDKFLKIMCRYKLGFWHTLQPEFWLYFNDFSLCILTFESQLFMCCTTSLTFNNCTLWPHCIYVFCIYLRTNSDLCHLQYKLIGFYNRDEKCLQRGTDWVFKWSGLRFVCKG
jgi:hypothetical protein